MHTLEWVVVGFVIVPTAMWMTLAVHYHSAWRWARIAASLAPLMTIGTALWMLPFSWVLMAWISVFGLTLAWWFSLRPQSERDWAIGMEVLPRVEINADDVQIGAFRNFDWSADGAAVPRYEDQSFDLARLRTVDYFLSHWSGPLMAHTLVSFGFDDGRFLALSVEARRRRWQKYSPLWGLFRSYELMFVIGDERDIVRVRTSVRGERVYLYRVRMPAQQIRQLLVDYLEHAKVLNVRPEWYNSVISNCTTNLFYYPNRRVRIPWWLKPNIFFNGLSARTLYRLHGLADSVPFKELQARSEILDVESAAGDLPDFSRRIRARMVQPRPWTDDEN
jgi:hypothetical protein